MKKPDEQVSVNICFKVSREDLIELVKADNDADNYELGPLDEATATRTLLIAVLQYHLYDDGNGPQLEGEFNIIQGDGQ